ncbi:murein peptide amidase A [bacterium]|nr:murein peptide amidase A [bacterium]
MKTSVIGKSASGLPIVAHQFGREGAKILILGGVHGDEPEGVWASMGLMGAWQEAFPFKLRVTVIPQFNVDGVLRGERANLNGVDLNRNMPTNDWSSLVAQPRYNPGPEAGSESETKALVEWLEVEKPSFVLSLHSWKPMLNTNGNCLREAQAIADRTQYEIKDSIGYPTPGCLGTYCGLERDMPTLTYEIEKGLDISSVLKIHVPAVHEALKVSEQIRQKSI